MVEEQLQEELAAEIVEKTPEQVLFEKNMAFALGDIPQEEQQEQHQQQAEAVVEKNDSESQKEVPSFDVNNYIKEKFGFENEEAALAEITALKNAKEEKEFKQRQFRSDWSNASARFNKEQIENYNFQIKCILENYHDDFYRKREIESLQRNLISNPNYMKYSKNEFHQKTERLAVRQNQEKRSDNDYDPPSPF